MSIELLPFQVSAADQIASRFRELQSDPKRPLEHAGWAVPFYQALSAIPGSGKTPVLADAIAQLRASLPREPIVLWISKAKAVVDQTFANFSPGGKYAHLVDGFLTTQLFNLDEAAVRDGSAARMAFSTVGAFNREDRGTLRVHKKAQDRGSEPLWTMLKQRELPGGRRPLLIVYDEAHNLSDQQADLLLELEPDAFLAASATMRTPGRLGRLIQRLHDHGWGEDRLVTSIASHDVVEAGLVKRQLLLGGYHTIMENALNDLLEAHKLTDAKANAEGWSPKAIYVCRTNVSQDDGSSDNPSKPFKERKAPPILIWQHLVSRGVDPKRIAIYCDLKMDRKNFPPPPDFTLFAGGEKDFAAFSAGNFTHIIFNLSLQEGWDDPSCCFAYIDKSMGSSIQVEQVIGRVLRQPGARHYADPDLNTASFFIRIDDKQEFPKILDTVRKKIAAEVPEIKIAGYVEKKERSKTRLDPRKQVSIPEVHIDSAPALDAIQATLKTMPDYRHDAVNTVGSGELVLARQTVGANRAAEIQRRSLKHSNAVMARWIVRRGVHGFFPEAAKSIDWSSAKFDARVEITSPAAATLRAIAEQLADAYIAASDLVFEEENPLLVGPVFIEKKKLVTFKNSVHEGYSDISESEMPFAEAIDATGLVWARNQTNAGFSIPLLEKGDRRRFFPDFLVWSGKTIFALDPKGGHLLARDAGVKLLDIQDDKKTRRIAVRLLSEGQWIDPANKKSTKGFTLWSLKAGKVKPRHAETVEEVVEAALK